eukprot:sb/3467029/
MTTLLSFLAEFVAFLAFWTWETFRELSYLILRNRPRKEIKGLNILITGTASGLGRKIARLLAKDGNTLHLVDINESQNQIVKEELQVHDCTVHAYKCDISNEIAVAELTEKVHQHCTKLDLLINNAGVMIGKLFTEESLKEFRFTQDVNVLGAVYLTKAFLGDFMGEQPKGHIAFISSLGGLTSAPYSTSYCTSKYGITGFIRSLQADLDYLGLGEKIRLTSFYPHFINTGLVEGCTVKVPALFPLLEPEWVAEQVVLGIKENREEVILPRVAAPLLIMQHFMTTKGFRRFCELLGNDMMKTFRQTRNHDIK